MPQPFSSRKPCAPLLLLRAPDGFHPQAPWPTMKEGWSYLVSKGQIDEPRASSLPLCPLDPKLPILLGQEGDPPIVRGILGGLLPAGPAFVVEDQSEGTTTVPAVQAHGNPEPKRRESVERREHAHHEERFSGSGGTSAPPRSSEATEVGMVQLYPAQCVLITVVVIRAAATNTATAFFVFTHKAVALIAPDEASLAG